MRAIPSRGWSRAAMFVLTVGLAAVLTLPAAPSVRAGSGGEVGASAADADWWQFRGPGRDGIARAGGLAASWPETGPVEAWRAPLGEGYSGIAVYKGRLFTQDSDGKRESVVCLDAASGRVLWRTVAGPAWQDRMGNGPRATPTVQEGRVYALAATGKLHALNAGDGEPLWSHDLVAEYGAQPPRWGLSGSPLIEGDLVIVDAGAGSSGSVLAFNKRTGKLIWRTFDDEAGYAAPIAIDVGGERQVVVFTARHVVGIAPADGRVLWSRRWKTSWNVNAATPIFLPPDRLLVSSGYDVGAAVLQITGEPGARSIREVWQSREMKNQFSSSVVRGGHAYGFDDNILKCIDVRTAERAWRQRGFGHGSLIAVDRWLLVLSDDGLLAQVEATPEGYVEVGRARIFTGKTWSAPSWADGHLYLRSESELVALRLGAASGPADQRSP